jgi:hypothetical protein
MTGLKPRDFVWVIAGRLAVSQRIGGYGFQHRRVRREEEIIWLRDNAKINTLVSLLTGNQNISAYEEAGFAVTHEPLPVDLNVASDVPRVLKAVSAALAPSNAVVLIHRDLVDESLAGLLAAYLISSGMVEDPIKAAAIIQEILGRPLGPEARTMMSIAVR